MVGYHILTQVSIMTLLMKSSPLILLMTLPPTLLHARASSLSSEPRCKFPRFMQTRRNRHWMMNQSNAMATFEVDGGKSFARHGACIRSRDYSGQQRQAGLGAECTKLNYTRVCLERWPGNKFLVRHVESDFEDKYMCLEFLRRGLSVVQVKMSLIQGKQFLAHLCDERFMHVGPWPWISEEHYRSTPVRCPFSGGYNLHLQYASPPPARRQGYYGSQVYYGPSYYSRVSADPRSEDCVDTTTAPIRMESDCVKGEGIVFHFKHQSCLPAGTDMALQQRALCMATWRSGREQFAMLRAHNNDRAFFCLRVALSSGGGDHRDPGHRRTKRLEMDDLKIDEVMLFLGWVCPTSSYADSASSSSVTGNAVSPLSTPHMALSVQDQQVITEPCSDQISLCHNHTSFCQHLHCMRTCGKCTASESMAESANPSHMSKKATVITSDRFSFRYSQQGEGGALDRIGEEESMSGENHEEVHKENHGQNHLERPYFPTLQHNFKQKCTFPQGIRGTWLRRLSDGNDETLVITDSTFNHPRLGLLECVAFTPPGATSAPLQRVLWSRYKNGCYPRFTCIHFNTPARSVMRYRLADMQLWPLPLTDDDICDQRHFMEPPDMYQPGDKYTMRSWEIVRRSGHIHKLACILPHYIPRVISFMDHTGRSGCLVHGTYYMPRDISLTFFPQRSHKASKPGPVHVHSHRKGHDVSSNSRDVKHRKSDVDHRKVHLDVNRGDSGVKKVTLIPYTDYINPEDKSSGFDYHNSNHKGQRFPEGRFISPKHHAGNHKDTQPEHEKWSENWYQNDHLVADFGEKADEHHGTKLSLNTKNNWTNYAHDMQYFNTFARDVHRNGHFKTDSHNRHPSNAEKQKRKHLRRNPLSPNCRHRYRRSGSHVKSRQQVLYQCMAVMTYVDSYKSLLTATSGNPKEILCWLVVNSTTIVVVRTSSCNAPTARQILASSNDSALHREHVYNIFHLNQGQHDCDAAFPEDLVRPQPIEFREEDSGASPSLVGVVGLVECCVSLCVSILVNCWLRQV